jgi:hypothetical protein
MRLEIRRGTETFLAHFALMRFLSSMHKIVLLKMRKLSELFAADIAFEWSFTGMRTKMDFQIAQLPKSFATFLAFISRLAIHLSQWIRQGWQ